MTQILQSERNKENNTTIKSRNNLAPKVLKEQERNKTKCNFLVTLTMTSFLTSCGTTNQRQRYSNTPTTKTKIVKNTRRIKGNIYTSHKHQQINNSLYSKQELNTFMEFYKKGGTNPYIPKNLPKVNKSKGASGGSLYDRDNMKEDLRAYNKLESQRMWAKIGVYILTFSPILLAF